MTTNNQEQQSIKESVLSKVKKGEVKMRSKSYFILRTILIALSIITVILFTLYIISFITFSLRARGTWFLPGFGFPGIRILFTSLPWLLILIALLSILVLEILIRRFSFSYRRPILYSMLAIIILVLLGSFVIGKTQFHSGLFLRAREGRLPVMGRFYQRYGIGKSRNMHHGVVSEITDEGFKIEKPDGQILTIIITPSTRFPNSQDIKENDTVVVLGEQDNSTVSASDIRKVGDELKIFQRPPLPRSPKW